MEMVHHQAYSNFYGYNNNYGNFNHQNDKSSFHSNSNFNDRLSFKSNKSSLDSKIQFSNLIKNNFNQQKYDILSNQSQDLDKNNEIIEFKPGMQDVPAWLKSLRLHKYKLIFSEMTYEEMLALTEKQLEEKNVTKGARHKIIVNIDKLRARQSNVLSMEKSIEQEGISGLKQSLNEIKSMLITPIKAFESENSYGSKDNIAEGDLPSQIISLLEKLFNYIKSENVRDDDILNLYLNNCDKCLGHEAFRASHKQRLITIKTKLEPLRYLVKNNFDKHNKMKGWINNMPSMTQSSLQNHYKNMSTNSLNNGYHNSYNSNGFSNQYNSNNSLNNQNFTNNPFQNNSKFSSLISPSQPNFFSAKSNQIKQNNSLNLVSNSNPFQKSKLSSYNPNKLNEPPLKFNVKAESFTSTRQLLLELNKKNKIIRNNSSIKLSNGDSYSNENRRKLSIVENRYLMNNDLNLDKFSEVFNEYNEKQTNSNQTNQTDLNNRIISPLSSCSLFNACSQIGHKINNQLTPVDKLNNLNLEANSSKNSNQFAFSNLFDNSTLMKCLENNTTLSNSNVFSHEKLESNYEAGNFDDKLDENHQIYNHIELLSLRMTEQALGSSEFS